jgi:hypothetical protein
MPACKGQAGKQEKMMKKKIGSVVRIGLVALLLTVVAVGTVFALGPITVNPGIPTLDGSDISNRNVPIKGYGGGESVWINDVSRSLVGINVTYTFEQTILPGQKPGQKFQYPGKVEFTFTAYFDSGIKPVTWTNVENITKDRYSTWRFTLQNYLLCNRLDVSARKL